ncbi:MAG: hypothetical protein GY884_25305, partial [Proteobacteria bacterium]|nr:hypothetical protein [Pseudomonadota bacterium]
MSSRSTAPLGSNVSNLLDRGLVRYAIGKRDEAISLWQQALEQAPRNRRAQDYLKSVGALVRSGNEDDMAVTGEMPPVTGEHDQFNGSAADSLVPPFTAEVATYDHVDGDDARSTDDLDAEPVVPDVEILLRNAQDDLASGNFEAALRHAEDALKRDPEHELAQELATSIRSKLAGQYREELEPLERVPFLRATDASILEL